MRETAGVPGDPTQGVSLDRSVGVGEHAPVMGGDPTPDVSELHTHAPGPPPFPEDCPECWNPPSWGHSGWCSRGTG